MSKVAIWIISSALLAGTVVAVTEDCYTGNGENYAGVVSNTISGKTCQRWNTDSPHQKNSLASDRNNFPEKDLNAAMNYCRNPDNAIKPWCYTTDNSTRWDVCNISVCQDANHTETAKRLQDLELTVGKLKQKQDQDEERIRDLADTITRMNATVQEITNKQKQCIQSFVCIHNNTDDWTPMLSRVSSALSFEKRWDEYVTGFGEVSGNFWLGLEKIHNLTCCNKQTLLRVEMWDWDNNFAFAEYSQFKVEDASTNYRATVSGYSGTAGDSLGTYLQRRPFSTIDRDNDAVAESCSQLYKGGWWYGSCHYANPTGIFYNPPTAQSSPYGVGINWFSWKGFNYSLKKITFKIRILV